MDRKAIVLLGFMVGEGDREVWGWQRKDSGCREHSGSVSVSAEEGAPT